MKPLDVYEDLLSWQSPDDKSECCTIDFSERKLQEFSGLPINNDVMSRRNKTLCCHDMRGGYLDDNIKEGNDNVYAYRFYHWHLIDAFIYFSHHFITIPPCGWTYQAHKNGVQCLGTLIIEPGDHIDNFLKMFNTNDVDIAASKLDEIRKFYNFDGWLINLECSVEGSLTARVLANICRFLSSLRQAGNAVIWYDAITDEGKLDWQNGLNGHNRIFYDHCGMIFTNYCWTDLQLRTSLEESQGHANNVYVGVDCFGRGCPGGGGFSCDLALEKIDNASKEHNPSDPKLSVALFAQAWCYENIPESELDNAIWHFYNCLDRYLRPSVDGRTLYRQLPDISIDGNHSFETCFDLGQGYASYMDGVLLDKSHYNNLLRQQVTPSGSVFLCNSSATVKFVPCREVSYTGYSCVRMVAYIDDDCPSIDWPVTVDLFRLGCHLPRGSAVLRLWLGLAPGHQDGGIWSGLILSLGFSQMGQSEIRTQEYNLMSIRAEEAVVVTATMCWHYFMVGDICAGPAGGGGGGADTWTLRKVALRISDRATLGTLSTSSLYLGRLSIESC